MRDLSGGGSSVPTSRLINSGVGLVGGGDLTADRTLTVAVPSINGFRLTLSTGVPVTTSDVTAATTIYFTPYKGALIALNNGSGTGVANWQCYYSAEISKGLGTLTASLPYDVFVYVSAGTLTIDSFVAWTNGTTRATAIDLVDGVYLKHGDYTRRYVGTFYTSSTTTTEDNSGRTGSNGAQRYLFNADNQEPRDCFVVESTASWTYSAGLRMANNSAANRLGFVLGVSRRVEARSVTQITSATLGAYASTSIGLDSTSVASTSCYVGYVASEGKGVNESESAYSTYSGYPGVGFHYLQQLESTINNAITITFYGGAAIPITGIAGMVWA